MAEAGRASPVAKGKMRRQNRRMGWRQAGPTGVQGRTRHSGHPKHNGHAGPHPGHRARVTKHSAPHKKAAEPPPPEVQTTDPVRNALELQPLTGGLTAPLLMQAIRGLPAARAKTWV